MDDVGRRFEYEVVEPMQTLLAGLSQNLFVDPTYSRLPALANITATNIYHFSERRHGVSSWSNPSDELLRQKIMEMADTAKHGQLRKMDRLVTLSHGLSFELDASGRVRFDSAFIDAQNARHGHWDVADTLLAFVDRLAAKEGKKIIVEKDRAAGPFQTEAISYVPAGALPAMTLHLRTGRRSKAGRMEAADPASLTFLLLEGQSPPLSSTRLVLTPL